MSKEAMQLALEALKESIDVPCYGGHPKQEAAYRLLQEALAEQQEPLIPFRHGCKWCGKTDGCEHQQPVQQEPAAFLANWTRFKMAFFESDEDGAGNTGTYVTCFNSFEKELDGRWVALVSAEDDCHLKLTPPAQRTWVGLTDDELADFWFKQSLDWMEFARVIEDALRSKNT